MDYYDLEWGKSDYKRVWTHFMVEFISLFQNETVLSVNFDF